MRWKGMSKTTEKRKILKGCVYWAIKPTYATEMERTKRARDDQR